MTDWGATEWAAFGAVGAFVVYVVLGVFAWVQILQAKQLRELQTRPYVVVDFEFRRFVIYIAVINVGATPARNVVVKFDEALQTTKVRDTDINEVAAFKQPIPMLAPGRSIRVTFDVFPQRLKEELPLSHGVQVSYEGDKGKQFEDPHYVIDLAQHAQAAVDPKGLPELVSEVHELRREVRKWTRGTEGLRVYTTDHAKYLARRDRPYWMAQAKAVRDEDGWRAYVRWWICRWSRIVGLRE